MTSDDHVKTLMNFDLGLLSQNDTEDSDNRENTGEKTNQPSVPQLVKSNLELQVKVEKQRKYMNILKERVIKTDLLVDKVKDSKEELVVVNTELAITREDCKNIYTDYQSSLDKCTQLENEIAVIKITNQQLEHKCFHTKSQFEALKSHSHQLQMLVKSHEEEIDTLKAAREKDKTDSKEFDKKISSFEKRNTTLLKHLHRFSKIVQSSKKKLTNRDQKLLKKYEKFNINDQSLSEDSDGGGELFQDCMSYSSLDSSQDADMGKADQISVKRITPLDLDNEAGSIDTGRGSSLAYSNNNSPEYFIGDIHLSKQNIESKSRVKLVSTATSPIPSKTIEISTSPLPTIFVTTGTNTYTENISFGNSRQIKTVNQALSPIISTLSKSIGTSPLKFSIKEAATSPINTPDSEEIHATQEKECLEINNSKNMDIDNTDFEIENILNVMKLDHTLITPIPNTPARTITVVEPANVTNTHHSQSEHANEYACQGAISAIEENKNLLRMIENLTKEVNDIKRNLLKNHVQMESNKEILFSIPSHREDNNRQESNSRTYSPPNERSDTTKLETCYMNTSKRKEVLITCDDKCSESVTELQLSSVEVDLTCNEGSVHSESQARHKSTTSNKRPCNESDDDDIIIFSSNVKKADKDKENSVVAENAQKKNKRPCGESDDDDIIIFSSNVILPPITAETEKDNKKSVVAENTHKNIKSFKSQILFGSSETSDEDSESWQDKSLEVENEHQERVGKKRNKGKVVSKLAKLKKSLKLKYKIKPEVTPLMRSLRSKRVVGKPVCKNYTSTSLNVKDAYERAVKVMAELKKKDNCNMQKFTPKISPEVQKIFAKQPQKACNDVSINKSLKEENGDVINKLSSSKTKNDNKILDPQKPGANKCVRSNEVKMSNKNLAIDKCNKNVCESNESSISKKENVQEQSKTNSINTIKQSCLSSKNKSLDNFSKNSLGNIKTRNRKSVDENLLNENKVRHNGSSMALKIRRSSEPLPKKSKLMSETKNTKTSTDNGLKIVTRNGSCSKTPNNDLQVSLENSGNKTDSSIESPPKKRRRVSDSSDAQNTRILRSSTLQKRFSPEKDIEDNEVLEHDTTTTTRSPIDSKKHNLPNPIQYDDLDIFSDYENNEMKAPSTNSPEQDTPEKMHSNDPKDSILCTMITKYGVEVVKRYNRKESDTAVNSIAKQLEQDIARIIQLNSNEAQNAMNMIVADLQKLNYKNLIAALIKYLSFPERKLELFGKTCIPPAPAMTKPEQVLLYVIPQLKVKMPHVDIVNSLLENIEYTLFRINCTPEFDVIETMSHFYAVLCRYFHKKSRLRVFILDSMYCLLFKAVPIIKQCLDVWMHIIPLAHMGIAKSPLVTTLVYLLHFYKCDDKFNRIQEIRTILTKKYFYNVTEWNDSKILEMFRNAITELKDNQAERKMLRLALIILAKRQEHQWCQNNIIKNILQPLIENDKTPESIKEFCISVMGPIMKPYPVDMKVYCEIAINQMTSIIQQNSSRRLKDAAIGSMMYLSRHNQNAINQTLLSTKMDQISLEQEDQIRDYIRSKPLKVWKGILTRLAQN